MNYREVQIEDDKAVDDAGTFTVDINLRDPITALIVRFKVRNDATALINQPPERNISKVELVDGGQVYSSLNGPMAVAAACRGLGRWPHQWYDERGTVSQRINFPLLFGRYLGDPDFAFDPTRLVNPQLKVTWLDQAGYDDTFHRIGITARVMEGVPAPAQCLLWKEVEAWNSASSGVHTVDLPKDHPYRALMIRPFKVNSLPSTILSHFKLDCDVGKLIVFDLDSHEMRDILKQYSGPYHHRQFVQGTSGTNRQAWMAECLAVVGSADTAGYIVNAINQFYPWFTVDIVHNDGTSSVGIVAQFLVTGLFPHSSYIYQFGRENDPATWFRSSQYGDIDLKLTEGAADAAVAVAVQQPRTLP